MIINRRQLAKDKLEELKNGYSTYAETLEIADWLEKEVQKLELNIHIDRTPIGSWFIPVKENELSME